MTYSVYLQIHSNGVCFYLTFFKSQHINYQKNDIHSVVKSTAARPISSDQKKTARI